MLILHQLLDFAQSNTFKGCLLYGMACIGYLGTYKELLIEINYLEAKTMILKSTKIKKNVFAILLFLSVVIVAIQMPIGVQAATTIFEDNFDSWNNGKVPSTTEGYTLDMWAGCSAMADNGRLKIVSTRTSGATSRAFVTKTIPQGITSGKIIVEYSMEIDNFLYAINGFPVLTNVNNSSSGSVQLYCAAASLNNTKVYNGAELKVLKDTSWPVNLVQKVRLIIDMDTKTYEVWMDSGSGYTKRKANDTDQTSTFNFRNPDNSIQYIRFLFNHPDSQVNPAAYYIDDLKVTKIDNLTLNSTSIQNGAVNIRTDSLVVLDFNKQLDASTIGNISMTQNGTAVPIEINVDDGTYSGKRCTVTFPYGLKNETQYQLSLPTSLKDFEGVSLQKTNINFTTEKLPFRVSKPAKSVIQNNVASTSLNVTNFTNEDKKVTLMLLEFKDGFIINGKFEKTVVHPGADNQQITLSMSVSDQTIIKEYVIEDVTNMAPLLTE
jgi:hypothetical protein